MATNFLWGTIGSSISLLSTELNSLANGTLSSLGSAVNNSGNYPYGRLSLMLGSASFVANSFVSIYTVPSLDGTNGTYPTLTSAAVAGLGNYFRGTIQINGSTSAQNECMDLAYIPPGYMKAAALTGGSTPTLAGSGNSLVYYPTPISY